MNDAKLVIAKQLIEILAKHPCSPIGTTVAVDREVNAVKRIIEAARTRYILPSFCAEMNDDAAKCIECILEHKPPPVCKTKIDEPEGCELDIEWSKD